MCTDTEQTIRDEMRSLSDIRDAGRQDDAAQYTGEDITGKAADDCASGLTGADGTHMPTEVSISADSSKNLPENIRKTIEGLRSFIPKENANCEDAGDETEDVFPDKSMNSRQLHDQYAFVYVDEHIISAKAAGFVKPVKFCILDGVRPDGVEEIIACYWKTDEKPFEYTAILRNIRNRGVHQVLVFTEDRLTGFQEACKAVFPESWCQYYWPRMTSLIREAVQGMYYGQIRHEAGVVYKAESAAESAQRAIDFCMKYYNRYPEMMQWFQEPCCLFNYYEFPKQLWGAAYSIRRIGGIEKSIDALVAGESVTEENLADCLRDYVQSYNAEKNRSAVKAIVACHLELEQMFERQLHSALCRITEVLSA